MDWKLMILVLLVVSCSATERRPIDGPSEPEVDAGPSEPPPTGPRTVSQPATFGGLVNAASVLEDRSEGRSSEDCLLRSPQQRRWPWILEAEVESSVRPVPEAPDDLDARLVSSGQPVLVITRWGQLGSRAFDVALATFTSASLLPGQPMVVLILTDRGLYLRLPQQRVSMGRTGPIPLPEQGASVADIEEGALIVVTAEAEVPLSDLRRLLRALPLDAPVVLAVALGGDIRIPDPPEPPLDRGTGMCPDGLPELPDDAPRGQLEAPLVIGSLGPLREAARICLETTESTHSPGGLVRLQLRIGAEGQVSDACLQSDELGGTEIRNCLLEAARATRFPVPRPQGFVDIHLPLRLQPSYQRAVCD